MGRRASCIMWDDMEDNNIHTQRMEAIGTLQNPKMYLLTNYPAEVFVLEEKKIEPQGVKYYYILK